MNLRLCTDNPEFYSDLYDVLRLFYGDVTVADCSGQAPEPGPDLYLHALETRDGHWIDRWSCGESRFALSTPVGGRHPLEVKRLRKRAVKNALYRLLRQITGLKLP